MSLINSPISSAVVDAGGMPNAPWSAFFSAVFNILTAITSSGTTANRPTKFMWVGRPYFDTTLNRPIWYTGTNWIRADGVVV